MRQLQVKDGRQEHYVEVVEITVEGPAIKAAETPMEVTGKELWGWGEGLNFSFIFYLKL